MSQAITPAVFPLLSTIFVRPSLLEAQVAPHLLDKEISVGETRLLEKLDTKKGDKLAKRWAPLLIHNALYSDHPDPDGELKAAMDRAEFKLKAVAASSWASAFRLAGEQGLPPTLYVRHLSPEQKRQLHVDAKTWKATASAVEEGLARALVGMAEVLVGHYAEAHGGQGSVSLKKLAKFAPKAS